MGILRKLYAFLIDILQSLLIAAAIFLVIYIWFFQPFNVIGLSMYPNFQDKSYVLTNKIRLNFEKPKLGDVIVFKAPPDPEKSFIKRVIGTPGDSIIIENGKVILNGKQLDESAYLKPSVKTFGGAWIREGQEITVPANSYFVLGDNREASSDSREWGLVGEKAIEGYSFFVYWPIPDIKVVQNPYQK
ncbi:MAG TPA: signal peptidase I [Patescibacteria group bacterium]|nr:signal peptidase I [Patescibacteria group bacterium]